MNKISWFSVFFVLAAPLFVLAAKEVDTYEIPNVRNDFCGHEIQVAFCRCAFTGDNCADMKVTQEQIHGMVERQFREWVSKQILSTAEQCIADGGYWNTATRQCITCTEGEVRVANKCYAPDKVPADAAEVQNMCPAIISFTKNWRSYSDFAESADPATASAEVQEYNAVLATLTNKITAAQALVYQMEIDRQLRSELRAYKTALVENSAKEITADIFHLAWMVYHTPDGFTGAPGSYRALVDPGAAPEALTAGLEEVRAMVPAEVELLRLDTTKSAAIIAATAFGADLESLQNAGDPRAAAAKAYKDIAAKEIPQPALSDDGIAAIRTQHLENLALDKALSESYAETAQQRTELLQLQKAIAALYADLQSWQQKEFTRAKQEVRNSCTQ